MTLFQAQKSYNESIKERDDKIALQEQYTAEILAQQSELDEKNSKLSSQDEQLDKQKKASCRTGDTVKGTAGQP
ncbi:hypothetical protein M5E86_20700 [Blautia wexlerae]|nr:hypothetical protein M5E86_20700 [Blautia wexlerae]